MRILSCIIILLLSLQSPVSAQLASLTHGGIQRNYYYHLPTGYVPGEAVPLVINMHGYTSTASQQQLYTQMNSTADNHGFMVIYPDGIDYAWNCGFNQPFHSGIDDVGFISQLIDELNATYSIDLTRVYATGMSMGGFMSYRLACELENRIAAIASVTGVMTDSLAYYCDAAHPVPVMQVHGTADQTVPYNGAPGMVSVEETVNYWVQHNACTATVTEGSIPDNDPNDGCTIDTKLHETCDEQSEVWLYKVNNGGHTWPGSPIDIGVTCYDTDINEDIWDFFTRFTNADAPLFVSVKEAIPEANIRIFPNPVTDYFSIESSTTEPIEGIRMFDISGKEVSFSYEENKSRYDVSFLSEGVYFLEIKTAAGTQVKKFLIH